MNAAERISGLPFITKQEGDLALMMVDSKLRAECPNTATVIRGRVRYLEGLLEMIYHHACDDATPEGDILADFDRMRSLAFEGWEGDGD